MKKKTKTLLFVAAGVGAFFYIRGKQQESTAASAAAALAAQSAPTSQGDYVYLGGFGDYVQIG